MTLMRDAQRTMSRPLATPKSTMSVGCWNSMNHVHSWKGVQNSARDGILQMSWPDGCCVGSHGVLV